MWRPGADSTWSDRCGITSNGAEPLVRDLLPLLAANPAHGFFGSVAFKYQAPEANPPRAALLARQAGFIPTTSGEATGEPPTVEKIAGMAAALGTKALAVASGITPDNAAAFVPYVRYFLVSTGISKGFYEFDAAKVIRLNRIVTGQLP